ncbi:LysR family transcriptional regulator [Lewinella sp. W8]|uniref:LysR family transcriptional regulator n=1 Tax=Lewinella sp. W8 TaxID=2528208 RepID=UPI0010684569|nr:LysR family transcriptional regulator [Lewinella sp. W8]MTB50855.1 LysR family transcriptional regulator [Lewinella sp. W8]
MNYTLSQLRVFQKVAQLSSVTQAAKELHLSQPAVSAQLKNFQDNFDLPLTEVIGRQLFITDFGHEIAAMVNVMLDQLYAIQQQSLIHQGQLSGRLKIATASTGQYVLPYFLSDFVNQHQGVELAMDVTNKAKVVESLKANRVDLCLVSIVPPSLSVNQLDLLPNKLFLVGKANAPLAEKTHKTDLLSELPLIYRETGSGTRQTMEAFLLKNKVQARTHLQLRSNEAVKQAVLAGLGYSIMPLIGLRNELRDKQLKIFSVRGLPIQTTWSLIWLKDKKLPPPAKALVEHLREEKEALINKYFAWLEELDH